MSKVCVICGKGGIKRKNGRHTSHNKKKTFANQGPHGLKAVKSTVSIKPNFREVKIAKGMPKVTTCMSCYKSIRSAATEMLTASAK